MLGRPDRQKYERSRVRRLSRDCHYTNCQQTC